MDLIGKLGYDGRGWSTGLNTAVGEAKHAAEKIDGFFSKPFAGGLVGGALSGLGFGSIDQAIEHIVHRATEIKDLSEQLGISTDEVQKFEHATSAAGLSFGTFTRGLVAIGNGRKEAAEGNEDLRKTFAKFGVELNDLQNPLLRDIDLFQKLAGTARGMELDSAGRKELRELLGGRGGDKLVGVFEKLEHVHVTPISEDDLKNIDEATKAVERLGKELEAIGAKPIAGIAGGFNKGGVGGLLDAYLTAITLPQQLELEVIRRAAIANAPELRPGEMSALTDHASRSRRRALVDTGTGENGPVGEGKPLYKDLAAEKKMEEYGAAIGKRNEAALKLHWEMLNPLERRLLIESQISDMIERRNLLPNESTEAVNLETAILEKRLQLHQMMPRVSFSAHTDSLARIGGLTTNGAAEQTFQDELLRQARRTADNTDPKHEWSF